MKSDDVIKNSNKRIASIFIILIILCFYCLYAIVVLNIGVGPIDYETFMRIGQSLIENKQIYGDNSYYPMPYVGIFAIFSLLPFSISFLLWVFIPVFCALAISGWSPLILLFGPLFGHFLGGQTAVFGMMGLWGYRKFSTSKWAGIWLSLLLLKPQLAIVPLGWVTLNGSNKFLQIKKYLIN